MYYLAVLNNFRKKIQQKQPDGRSIPGFYKRIIRHRIEAQLWQNLIPKINKWDWSTTVFARFGTMWLFTRKLIVVLNKVLHLLFWSVVSFKWTSPWSCLKRYSWVAEKIVIFIDVDTKKHIFIIIRCWVTFLEADYLRKFSPLFNE